MKSITAHEIKNGDNIQTVNGHQFFDVDVEMNIGDGSVDVYGQDNAVKLHASQLVYLMVKES